MAKILPKDPKILAKVFSNRSINTSEIAFYNSKEFLAAEKNDPDMLSFYACHVDQMVSNAEQLKHNALCIETLCKILHCFIIEDDQVGTCVDLSGMVSKFLEAYGIWNYCISGSMNFYNPDLKLEGNTTYFWALDTSHIAGHAWVVAPPYAIIDLSVRSQPYTSNELDLIPDYILQKSGDVVSATTQDHVSPERRFKRWGMVTNLHDKAYYDLDQKMKKFDEYFLCYEFMVAETKFRYLCGGVLMSDAMSIRDLKGRKWRGKYPSEIFEEIIKPKMAEAGFEVKFPTSVIG